MPLGIPSGPPQGPRKAPSGHRKAPGWTGPADALDGARTGFLWGLALVLPYLLAGALWAACVALGATRMVEPHGWELGAAWGALVAFLLWLLRVPRVALGVAVGALVALVTS